ncbi:MAG: hypothetical protein KJZ54_00500 [Phycisphaerales bacterium]|nr:hypothetical protein [Phycisphaerales bacterium]
MGDIGSINSLAFALVALLPGFVSLLAFRAVVPRQPASGAELSLLSLAFGVVNACLHAWWLLPLVLQPPEAIVEHVTTHRLGFSLATVAYSVATPLLLGYFAGIIRQRIAIPGVRSPAPTAWDWCFQRRPAVVVYATLRDGTRVAGLFTRESDGFASSYPEPQTIYCGKQFPLGPDGAIVGPPPEESKGLIIRADECKLIEFLDIPTVDRYSLFSEIGNEASESDNA